MDTAAPRLIAFDFARDVGGGQPVRGFASRDPVIGGYLGRDRSASRIMVTLSHGAEVAFAFRDQAWLDRCIECEFRFGGRAAIEALRRGLIKAAVEPLADALGDGVLRGLAELDQRLFGQSADQAGAVLAKAQALAKELEGLAGDMLGIAKVRVITTLSFNPMWSITLLVEAIEALNTAIGRLDRRVATILRQVEARAGADVVALMDKARAAILAEGTRFFDRDARGMAAAFGAVKGDTILTSNTALPALKAALSPIVPLARTYLDAASAEATATWGHRATVFANSAGETGADRARNARETEGLTEAERAARAADTVAARQKLMAALGALGASMPIALQLDAEDVVALPDMARKDAAKLLFGKLQRCFAANRAIRARAAKWKLLAREAVQGSAPEEKLRSDIASAGAGSSAWLYPRRVAAAAAGLFDPLHLAHDVVRSALGTPGWMVLAEDMLKLLGRDLLITEGVDAARRAMGTVMVYRAAKGLGALDARLFARALPVANWVIAGINILHAAGKYAIDDDDFRCALDPREALIAQGPDFVDLLETVVSEVAFALV